MKSRERLVQLQQQMREQADQPRRARGRPRLPIDPTLVFELALLGLSDKDIAARLPCDRKTLRHFAADLERARALRQASRKMQLFGEALDDRPQALARLLRTRGKRLAQHIVRRKYERFTK